MPNTRLDGGHHSMRDRVQDTLSAHHNEFVSLLSRYVAQGKGILQPHHLIDELANVLKEDEGMQKLSDSPICKVLQSTQRAFFRHLSTVSRLPSPESTLAGISHNDQVSISSVLPFVQESKVLKFLGFMWNPLSWVMEAAAVMAIALAHRSDKDTYYPDFVGIIVLLIINSTISFVEENNVGNAAAAIMARLAPKTKVYFHYGSAGCCYQGKITYNGHNLYEFVPEKTSAYVSQQDCHVVEMTVRTLIDL